VRGTSGFWSSPARNLIGGLVFVALVAGAAVTAYMAQGWSFGDALYMTVLTIYTVGYDEVHPIDTPALRVVTLGLIVLGCTGMIFVTGALVQFITFTQVQDLLGVRRMQAKIDRLRDHVIVCGFGRIGTMLARDLHRAGAAFIIVERSERRVEEARGRGYLCLHADATEEGALRDAAIGRARVLATVLPDDAANVFITLSARSLNPSVRIIARGEAPSTESKLMHAGAHDVVLPAHIGAERMAEMILYPRAMHAEGGSEQLRELEQGLRRLGLAVQVAIAEAGAAFTGLTVAEIERRAAGAFLIAAIEHAGGGMAERAAPDTRVVAGDGVVMLARGGMSDALRGFSPDD
jgi:voltage-gated potassium channel Kch